jgi:hypothetical protein
MTASRFRIAARTALLSSLLTFSAILVWPFPAHSQAPEARSKPELVTSDSSRATAGGATFTVPAGWSIETEKNLVILATGARHAYRYFRFAGLRRRVCRDGGVVRLQIGAYTPGQDRDAAPGARRLGRAPGF